MRLPVFIYTKQIPAITFHIRLADVKAGILFRQMLILVTFVKNNAGCQRVVGGRMNVSCVGQLSGMEVEV